MMRMKETFSPCNEQSQPIQKSADTKNLLVHINVLFYKDLAKHQEKSTPSSYMPQKVLAVVF